MELPKLEWNYFESTNGLYRIEHKYQNWRGTSGVWIGPRRPNPKEAKQAAEELR